MNRLEFQPFPTHDGDIVGHFGVESLEGYVLLGRIAEAVANTAKVRVRFLLRDSQGVAQDVEEFEGVARHVVAADHAGFARLPWQSTDRLRVTTGWETFLPLRDIVEIEII